MNTGQTMLSILAVMLLGLTVLSVNRNSINQGTILRQTELGVYAVSLATSYIQKAKSMDFDELTIPGLPITLPQLTPATGVLSTNLRLETGTANKYGPTEYANKDTSFDDFDDYNGFAKDDTITGVDVFHITAEVYYVSNVAPFGKVTSPTWLKQINIKVNNTVSRRVFEQKDTGTDTGTDTIRFSYIKSFYY